MNLEQYLTEITVGSVEPTQEMIDFFEERTRRHITYVVDNCVRLSELITSFGDQLTMRCQLHDQSKYSAEEYIPYVWMTWKYKIQNEGGTFDYHSEVLESSIKEAGKHHITSNRHHPEFHGSTDDMTIVDIAEMVCDWHAMSIELSGDTKKWADDNVGTKWTFNESNTKLIYLFIEALT